MFRFLKAIWNYVFGRVDKASEGLESDPQAMDRTWAGVIQEEGENIGQMMDAVESIEALRAEKEAHIEDLRTRLAKAQKEKQGALNLAIKRHKELGTDDPAELLKDTEMARRQGQVRDKTTTIKQLTEDVDRSQKDLASMQEQVNTYMVRLESMRRNIEVLRQKRHASVAAVISSQQAERLNKILAGISFSGTGEKIQRLEMATRKAEAGAKISATLARTDGMTQDAELAAAADQQSSDTEFLAALGLADKAFVETKPTAAEKSDTEMP